MSIFFNKITAWLNFKSMRNPIDTPLDEGTPSEESLSQPAEDFTLNK